MKTETLQLKVAVDKEVLDVIKVMAARIEKLEGYVARLTVQISPGESYHGVLKDLCS